MKKETRILKDAVHKSIDIFFATKNGSSDNDFIQKKIRFFMSLSSICHFFLL